MNDFRINLREKLPLIILLLCIFNIVMFIRSILSFFTLGEDALVLTNVLPIIESLVIGILIFIFRKRNDLMIRNIAYLILCYFMFLQSHYILRNSYIFDRFTRSSETIIFNIIFTIVLLVLVILLYERGIIKDLFVNKSHLIDKIFFSSIFAKIAMLVLFTMLDLWFHYRNLEVFGLFYSAIDQNIVLLLMFFMIFIINIIPMKEDATRRTFNLYYMIFVVFIIILLGVVRYINTMQYHLNDTDSTRILKFFEYANFSIYAVPIIFYIILKYRNKKDTKNIEL